MAPIKGSDVDFKEVMWEARTGHNKLKVWPSSDKGICPAFLQGLCTFWGCKAAHLYDSELPGGYATNYCTVIKLGVERVVVGDKPLPRKHPQ